jgi:hypothetical protein
MVPLPFCCDMASGSGSRAKSVMFRALSWCATVALYLVLAGQLGRAELVTALVLATGVAAWSALIRGCSPTRFAIRADQLPALVRAAAALGTASWRVAGSLLRAAVPGAACASQAVRRRFHYGRARSPADRSRRAAALLAASLGPESFIVRMPRGRAQVLVHRIASAPATTALPPGPEP